ncbi:MAG: LapA family protein [Solirubrobacterales bacterium]|nr:LapA family protein [Solirubrobacterales bacterium]
MTTRSSGRPRRRTRLRSTREKVRLGAAGAAIVLAILFGVLNLDRVKVDWIVTTSRTPLIIVIAVSFLIGAAAGALVIHRRGGR